MDSKLSVESVYGKGSVFSFSIRQGIADPRPVGDLSGRQNSAGTQKAEVTRRFTGARVLVTDDNDLNLMVARNLLKLFGIKPDLASSGDVAIQLMSQKRCSIPERDLITAPVTPQTGEKWSIVPRRMQCASIT